MFGKPPKFPGTASGHRPAPTPLADWTMPFLKMLAHTGNVLMASKAAGITRVQAYRVRKERAEFRKLWDEALEDAILELEEIARKRAVTTSDTLLIFLLKAHRPDKYRERVDIRVQIEREREAIRERAIKDGLDPDMVLAEVDVVLKQSTKS